MVGDLLIVFGVFSLVLYALVKALVRSHEAKTLHKAKTLSGILKMRKEKYAC